SGPVCVHRLATAPIRRPHSSRPPRKRSSTRQKAFNAVKGKQIETCPFANLPEKKGAQRMDREKMATVRWLRPRIVPEIAFNERTQAGHLRHSKFLRLRDRA